MAKNTFQHSATNVQIPAPRYPYATNILKAQSSARTLGGSFYVYDRSLITKEYTLIIPKVAAAVLDQISSFFDTQTMGSQIPFTWTDHLGVARTVKLRGPINASPYTPTFYKVTLTLFEQFTDESVFQGWPYLGADYVGTGYVQT